MKVSKEIAEKAAEYEALKEKSDKLFEELQKWFSENADMDDCYLYGFGVAQEADGEEQEEGEYCNQYQRGEDSFDGTYYWAVEDSTQYVWVNYSI
ncbi:hypothetical protein [Enterocloster clostridioformis]|jgi:hypothetical protein|uniref:Uncharacterized protein n=1 Tax=[Clostridium] clostridioforme 90A8 TaxID=999408 RepID=A0A0E2H7Z5_9FIRM|nr:hypothetical protein [Enterocloster clostridioformis]ENZ12421.1 hypothetical protein HMPREF1090_03547 [[Clostridium] clostridioforme 90A8]